MNGSISAAPALDRAASVRDALRRLVAERGFHGASMSAVAREAGVATGTAYVHYGSKDELVIAAYLDSKQRLGEAAVATIDPAGPPEARFHSLWTGAYHHLIENPNEARFLVQVEDSPYATAAHAAAINREEDPLIAQTTKPDMAKRLLRLPLEVLYELGLAPAVRLAARGIDVPPKQAAAIADACWRAITHPT